METNKPGGFLLAIMEKITDKDDQEMIKIEKRENKIRLLNQKGVVTYGFKRGFDNDFFFRKNYMMT